MSLSVIVPNFNHARLIGRALRAFLNQTPPAKEIIVIDDGSTDDSVEIIDELAHEFPTIRPIRHKTNRGIVAAVRSGLEIASGDRLLFGSSDDFVLSGLNARADTAFRRYPGVAFFCSGVALADNKNEVIGMRPVTAPRFRAGYLSPDDVRCAMRSTDFWYLGTTTIYQRKMLADVGYFAPELGSIGDTLTNRLLAFRHGLYFDPAILGVYNKDPTSFSAQKALSVEDSLRMLSAARTWIGANFPEDVREEQQGLFDRRMRFGFARLWVVWRDKYPNTEAISDILSFGKFDRVVLGILGRVPLMSGAFTLGWMTVRMRPFGFFAMIKAWLRSFHFKRVGRAAVQHAVDRIAASSKSVPS